MVKLHFFLANSIFTPIFKILVRTLHRLKSSWKVLFLNDFNIHHNKGEKLPSGVVMKEELVHEILVYVALS